MKWIAKIRMMGRCPYDSHAGTVMPIASSHPACPPVERLLNIVSHARANVHAGSMYGTMSAVANHFRPHMSVRTSSHAAPNPITRASTTLPTAITSVFTSGPQKIACAWGETSTRHR